MASGRSLATAVAAGCALLFECSAEDRSSVLGRNEAGLSVSVGPTEFGRRFHSTTLLPSGKVLVAGGTGNLVAELFDPSTGTWRRTGRMGVVRNGHSATLLPSGKVLVAGGYASLASEELYDPATETWSPTGSLSQPCAGPAEGILIPSGKVLVVCEAQAELYDPATGSWTRTGSPSTSRYRPSVTLLASGKVLLAGGGTGSGLSVSATYSSAEVYDPATGRWSATGSMVTARAGHAATLLPSGKVLVAGGHREVANNPSHPDYLADAEVYDPATGTWSATGSLATRRTVHSATLLPSGKVLVLGGGHQYGVLATVEVFDASTGTWATAEPLQTARGDHTATLLASGKVLLTGGSGWNPVTSTELYDLYSGTRGPASPLQTGRSSHTETLLLSGKMLVAGGLGIGGAPLASSELYEPAMGRWTASGELGTARSSHTATLLRSGRVLVAGGTGPSGVLGSTEVYEPSTARWNDSGALNTVRSGHTATLLPSGKLLVVGGTGTGGSALATAEVYEPSTGSWSPTGALGAPRVGHTATLLPSGKVLVAGGQGSGTVVSSVEVYDSATGTWTAARPMTTARTGHAAILLTSGKVMVVGGQGPGGTSLATSEVFDPSTGVWVSSASLGAARVGPTATLLPSGKVVVSGGQASGGVPVASVEVYDPAGGTWHLTTPLAVARRNHAAAILPSGNVLITGGSDGSGPLASVETYSPAEGASTASSAMVTMRRSHTATLLPSGKVLIAGGFSLPAFDIVSSAEVYDPVTGSWVAAASLPMTRTAHTATLLQSGQVIVVGGLSGNPYLPNLVTAELYGLDGRWSTTGSLSAPRYSHTAALLPSGKVLVAGGSVSGVSSPSAEVYDPERGTWTITGAMSTARTGHTATLLPSGKVLVTGGGTATAELYDPTTGTWRGTAPLSVLRSGHSATLLPSGKVLVAGGYVTDFLASAELYDPATETWSSTGSLATARSHHFSVLLPSGKVTVMGGGNLSGLSSVEVYDPESGTWSGMAPLGQIRWLPTATLLPSGRVLVAGGDKYSTYDTYIGSELWDEGRGAKPEWTPGLATTAGRSASPGTTLSLPGTLFTGVSEGSGGATQFSAANYPLVQIERQENQQTAFATITAFTPTSLSATLPTSLLPGWHWLRVIVNGVASAAQPLFITPPLAVVPAHATVAPKQNKAFSTSGGSGSGRAWTILTNASGGSIDPTSGVYVAGPIGGVTDIVQVTDSSGDSATSSVDLTAGVGVSPGTVSLSPKGGVTFTASGGSGTGFTWSLMTNASGGSIAPDTGAYAAGPTGSSIDVVQVRDSLGNLAQASVSVTAAVSVSPATASVPPRGSLSFAAKGGSGSGFSWSLTTNASGGTIDSSTGAYVAGPNGATTDVVQVTDSLGNVATKDVTVTAGVSVSPASASAPPKGSLALGASGGSGTGYTWSLVTNASGGSLDAATGAYTAGATGSVTDVVQVVDSLGNTATRSITVTAGLGIAPATLSLAPRAARTLSVSGGSGTGFTWSLTTNASGSSIGSTTGAYGAGPTPDVTDIARVTDSLGNVASLTIVVTRGVTVAPSSVSLAPRGTVTLSASGGAGAGFAWELQSNASGGTVSSAGVYTAGPTGGVTDIVRVTDSVGNTALCQVAVTAGVSVSPATATLAPKADTSFVASGGSAAGFSWSFVTNASGGSIGSSTGAYLAGPMGDVTDVIQVRDSLGNVAQVSVTVASGLVVSPASASTAPRGSLALGVSGGSGAGYGWSLVTNASGGTIDAATGAYAAGSTGSVTDVVQVMDSLGNVASRSVTVTAGVGISPQQASAPPRGSLAFTASGGKGVPYTWTLSTNASGGVIDSATGVYTAGNQGSVTDVVRVEDALGSFAQREVTVAANLAIDPSAAVVARGGRIAFTATGGAVKYTWSLTLHSTSSIDVVTGVYTAGSQGGVKEFVTVTDSVGSTASCEVTITEDLAVAPSSATVPPKGRLRFVASAGTGRGYAWSLAANGSGGIIDAASGEYTAGATGGVTDMVRLTDSAGNVATVSVTVSPGLALSPETASVAPKGRVVFSVAGGSGTGFSWSLSTNASGGAIDATSGGYTAGPIGGVTDVVEVTDSLGNRATRSVAVTSAIVVAPLAPTVAPHGTVAFSASGGSGTGYAWSLSTNASGGSIDAAMGLCTAGPTPQATDVVQVTDSLGNVATTTVTVTVAATLSPATGGCGCQSTSEAMPLLALGLVALLRRRVHHARRP